MPTMVDTRPRHYFTLKLRIEKDGTVLKRFEFPVKAKRDVARDRAQAAAKKAEEAGFIADVAEVVSYR